MKTAIIVIGDELLIGQVTDTNSGMMARAMAPYGWDVTTVMTVSDDAEAIRAAIMRGFEQAQVVLTTGGLGPTKDDITKRVLMDMFGGELHRDEAVLANVKKIFARKGLRLNPLTEAQADVPTSCRVIQNEVGTAPIMWFQNDKGRVLVAMPGVPSETAAMFGKAVMPSLLAHFSNDETIEHRTIVVYGISESDLAGRLDTFERSLPEDMHLAYLPHDGIIRLRLDCRSKSLGASEVKEITDRKLDDLKHIVEPWLVADSDLAPAEMLLSRLYARGLTVATAESCTGGNIAHLITLIPGSSTAMLGGVVSYSNDVKMRLLGVKADTLDSVGAVSEEVARQMAQGTRHATGADLGISTSGIAGPGGGSEAKPVGTVCMSVSLGDRTVSATRHFGGNREQIIGRASVAAIMMAIQLIDNKI